jgi:predicted ferric reductase
MIYKKYGVQALLGGLAALICLGWAFDLYNTGGVTGGTAPWNLRKDLLYLSGLLAIGCMSLAVFLSTRPLWLSGPLGGMGGIFQAHKWAGILTGIFAGLHWFIDEVAGDILKALYGKAGKVPKLHDGSLQELLRSPAKEVGEWAIYLLLALLLLALIKRLPWKPLRLVHRAMPLLYLLLTFHALVLMPRGFWTQPLGLLMALLLSAGTYGSLIMMRRRIARLGQRTEKRLGESNG